MRDISSSCVLLLDGGNVSLHHSLLSYLALSPVLSCPEVLLCVACKFIPFELTNFLIISAASDFDTPFIKGFHVTLFYLCTDQLVE